MENFYAKLSEKMADLVLAVVALGILVVSVEYIQYMIDVPDALARVDYWKRVTLTLIVIAFTSYYFIAYTSYFSASRNDSALSSVGPERIVAMFLLDLVQVTLTAWLYALLLIGNLTSAGGKANADNLIVEYMLLGHIFAIMGAWHLMVMIWYIASRGDRRDKMLHLIYVSIYSVLAACSYVAHVHLSAIWLQWILIFAYFLCIAFIYRVKAVSDIKAAIETCSSQPG